MKAFKDFVVESNGHCFLCLDVTSTQFSQNGRPDQDDSSVRPTTCSLQFLSQYLGIDLQKVFHEGAEDLISPHLFKTVKNSKLKGELCGQCAVLNANFDRTWRKLEKIQMDVNDSLNQIYEKLLKHPNELDGFKSFSESTTVTSTASWSNGKLTMLDVLRTATIEKCSRMLSASPPRVKIQNFSKVEIDKATKKMKRIGNSSENCRILESTSIKSEPELESIITVKMEYGSTNIMLTEEVDNFHLTAYSDAFSEDSARDVNVTKKKKPQNNEPCTGEPRGRGRQYKLVDDVVIPRSRINPNTGKYKCTLCPSEFIKVSSFTTHYKSTHLNLKYKCTICGKEFTTPSGCRAHKKSVHMRIRFPCQVCGRRFACKSYLEKHTKVASCRLGKASTWHCQICGKSFSRKDPLKRHLLEIHSKLEKHVCNRCGKKFTRRINMIRHMNLKVGCGN